MMGQNPVFNMTPTTPPGFAGIPYTIGNFAAPYLGGVAHPYVPPNQSITDAWTAKNFNDPGYRKMLESQYGQMGGQLGNTLGNIRFVGELAKMSGYSPTRIRQDLANFGRDVGGSLAGSLIMPFADMALDYTGLSGGSFSAATSAAFSNRMNMLSPGTMFRPQDAAQSSMALSGATAMMSMVNGMVSRRDKGVMSIMPDTSFTRGFDRQTITQLAMDMAGAGAFTTREGGLAERMTSAAGGYDIGKLEAAAGDFTGGGKGSNVSGKASEQIKKIHYDVKAKLSDAVEAMGAMRDMLKTMDGVREKLSVLTNGEWLKGGSKSVAADVRQLHAMTQAYNIDPNQAMNAMLMNRATLQDAAGITPEMQAAGMDGGGMFRLGAQTEFMASVEDMITARGVRGDRVKSNALRGQALQAMSRNMNTQAGVAAQVLAYGRQIGVISETDAARFEAGITSGDRGVMGDTINRMLTTVFGSAKKGRELMQDSMFVNSMRQALNDESGKSAMMSIIKGADREWMRQEIVTSAADRFATSRSMLSSVGMKTVASDEDVGRIVDSIAGELSGEGGGKYSAAFRDQYEARVRGGMKANAALQATIRSFNSTSATAKFSERISLAMNRQGADNNEALFRKSGQQSGQAKAIADAMRASGDITAKQHAEILRKIRDGKGDEALADADRLAGSLSESKRGILDEVRANAGKEYEAALNTIDDKAVAEKLVAKAGASGYDSNAITESFTSSIDAAKKFMASKKGDRDVDRLYEALSKSKYSLIFGDDAASNLVDALKGPDAQKVIERMGGQSVQLRQLAVKNLQGKGYGLNYSGYWGGGKYAGNDEKAMAARDKVISEIANGFESDNTKLHKDRQTLIQNFVDMLSGGNLGNLLNVYDKTGAMSELTADYRKAYDAWSTAQSAFSEKSSGLTDAVKVLTRAGKHDEAKRLSGIADSIIGTRNLDNIVGSFGLDEQTSKKLREALSRKADVNLKKQTADAEMKKLSKKEGAAEIVDAFEMEKEYADARRESAYGRAFSYMDETLDTEDLFSLESGRNSSAWAATKKAVTDDKMVARYGESVKKLSGGAYRKKQLELLKEQANAGDKDSMAAVDKYAAAERKSVQRIRGTLKIDMGGQQVPAILEGDLGGMSA